MCGIVGMVAAYSNGFTNDEQELFTTMLFLDTQRGWDSTGSFLVSNTGNMHMKKAALHGPDFVRTAEYKNLLSKAWTNGMFMVGHNRAATRGTVSDENAHPFCVNDDKIVLVQNGTYVGSHKHLRDTEVDTEAVAWAISEDDDLETSLQRINAAYALAYYDFRDKSLNLIRNEQRPMFLVETADAGWLFASEIETIFYAASKAKIKLKGIPKQIEPGEHHKWTLTDKKQHIYTCTKIDHKFRYKSGETTYDSELAAWEEYYANKNQRARHEFYPVTVAKPPHIREVINNMNNRDGLDKTIYDYVNDNKFHEFAADQQICAEYRAAYAANKPDSIVVEFIDYLPARDVQAGSKSKWYVYGKQITPDPDNFSPVFYMFVEGDETVAFDFTVNSLYTVITPGSPVTHRVTTHREEAYHLLTCFVSQPIPVKVMENTENGSTH